MQTFRAACNAMATRFEMVLPGDDPVRLRAAADTACRDIERLHAQLSLYSPSSEISYINAHAAQRAVKVEPGLFALLQLAQRIHEETSGAFDITVGPLMRCWGFMGGSGSFPSLEQIAEARAQVGMHHVLLNEKDFTVRFDRPGIILDLGSIGKGHALDVAAESLREAGIEHALIHGGTSTVCAFGASPEGEAWKVAIDPPPELPTDREPAQHSSESRGPLAVISLQNEALSVSGVHGKCFEAEGKIYGHVLDPRTGVPAQGAVLAAAVLPSGAESDAFSTALLLEGLAGQRALSSLRPGMKMVVAERTSPGGRLTVESTGIATVRWGSVSPRGKR